MQIIAREVDLEIMRRITPRNTEMATDKKNTKNKPKEFKKPNHLQRLETKPMKNQKAMETVKSIHIFLIFNNLYFLHKNYFIN